MLVRKGCFIRGIEFHGGIAVKLNVKLLGKLAVKLALN